MANYIASGRSNYFKVKDLDSFTEAMSAFPVEIRAGINGRICLLNVDPDGGGWNLYNQDTDETHDPQELIGPHLADDEVCVLMEAGAEKLRYINGYALAFTNDPEQYVSLSLSDIYDKARDVFGPKVNMTFAEY